MLSLWKPSNSEVHQTPLDSYEISQLLLHLSPFPLSVYTDSTISVYKCYILELHQNKVFIGQPEEAISPAILIRREKVYFSTIFF